jgi:transcriptional regulator with GAF, ATPase, and Fis domain
MRPGRETVEEALRRDIEALRRENQRLLESLAEQNFGRRLEKFLQFLDITVEVAQMGQRKNLLKMLMDTVTHLLDCDGASILMLDPATDELYFEEAVGAKGEDVKKFRLPKGEGLAGFVAATGEPLAVSDARSDYRLKRTIDQSTGYETRSLLAVPLIFNGRTLGVLEAVNKKGNRAFTPQDIKTLTLLADFSAAFVRSSHLHDDLYALFLTLLDTLVSEDKSVPWRNFTSRLDFQVKMKDFSSEFCDSVKLAGLVGEIASHGDREKALCRRVLEGVLDFIKDQK